MLRTHRSQTTPKVIERLAKMFEALFVPGSQHVPAYAIPVPAQRPSGSKRTRSRRRAPIATGSGVKSTWF